MTSVTQSLHDEHKELFPHVEQLRRAAEMAADASIEQLRVEVEAAYKFLALHLVPHAQAEEAALYPVVQKALGSREATRTMARDHVEVGRYIAELAELRALDAWSGTERRELQRVLYGLYALLRVHFAKEEEVYLPILDEVLSAQEAREMFEAMEATAHEAKEAAVL